MPKEINRLTEADILPMAEYETVRKQKKADILPAKQLRRVEVGPFATFYFENYDTMWLQVHEMLRIEKGGAAQIASELEAFNPLIPQGRELIATLMFEIEDALRRTNVLKRLGHVEDAVFFDVGGERIAAEYERDVERTTEDGKASSVHFLHFPFTDAHIARFKDPLVMVVLGIAHDNYAHMAVVSPAIRAALAQDFT